jgi:hypothetical protein
LREASSDLVSGKTGMTRRDACVALSAFSILGDGSWGRAEVQAPAAAKGTPVLDKSTSYSMAEMPTTKSLNGAVVYHAFIGALTTGELVDVHETTVQGIFDFGPYSLNVAERILTGDGVPVQLPPRAFDLLVLLVERAPHLVTKLR